MAPSLLRIELYITLKIVAFYFSVTFWTTEIQGFGSKMSSKDYFITLHEKVIIALNNISADKKTVLSPFLLKTCLVFEWEC